MELGALLIDGAAGYSCICAGRSIIPSMKWVAPGSAPMTGHLLLHGEPGGLMAEPIQFAHLDPNSRLCQFNRCQCSE